MSLGTNEIPPRYQRLVGVGTPATHGIRAPCLSSLRPSVACRIGTDQPPSGFGPR
jgi:hypothetical protein